MDCPCGSRLSFDECCGPYLAGRKIPTSPEALMRSRYVAFTKNDQGYIKKTMRGRALDAFDETQRNAINQHMQWLQLEILEKSTKGDEGIVKFRATFRHQGKVKCLVETSLFHRIDAIWFYVDALSVSVESCDQ